MRFFVCTFWSVSLLLGLFLSTGSAARTLTKTAGRGKSKESTQKTHSDTFTNSVSYLTDAQRAQQLRYFRLFIGYIYMVDTFSAATHGTFR